MNRISSAYVYERFGRVNINLCIYISLKNKYIYFRVGKTGSSTVTYHLYYAEYINTNFVVKDVNSQYFCPHLRPFQLDVEQFEEILNSPRFWKIAFVRNPYTRLLSCYLHRIIGEKTMNPSKKVLYKNTEFNEEHKSSFREFVKFVCDQETTNMERHWRLQSFEILWPQMKFDFVGRQEQLSDDLNRLELVLYGKPVFDQKILKCSDNSPMKTNASKSLRNYYDDETARLVYSRYRDDFETFDYAVELPL